VTTYARRLLVVTALCAAGCSSGSSGAPGTGGVSASGGSNGSASGGNGQTGSGGTSGGGTPGSGGRSGSGGLSATGGASASGGVTATGGLPASGGAPGSGGRPTATGGSSSGGTTGAAGAPGSGGQGTAGGAGGAPAGSGGADGGHGGASDPLAAAQVLDGFALLKPCFSAPGSCAGCTCDENASNILNTGVAPENQHISKQFGGDAAMTYDVKLRVVGVAERYWYTGGMLDATGKVFYTGGLPTIHSTQAPNTNLSPGQGACKIHPPQTDSNYPLPFTVPPEIAPADNCYNGFNIFAMTVSSPKQTYFLNYTTDYDGVDRQPHAVYKTDYTITIPIAGQAKIDFYVIDGDHHQVANTTMTVPNVKNTQIKQPYSGNFLELEVVDVALAPVK